MADHGMDLARLMDQLKVDEGLRLVSYTCPAGKRTIGYGHNMDAWPLPSDIAETLRKAGSITQEQAEILLLIDTRQAVHAAQDIVGQIDWAWLSTIQRECIANMVFNLGPAGLRKFKKMLQAIRSRDIQAACREMKESDWYHQTGARAERIAKAFGG